MKTFVEGGCVCGGTRYRIRELAGNVADCHCVDCRRSAGAPFVTWGSVARTHLEITKGTRRTIAHAGRLRSFAACCGTHLFFAENAEADTVDVTIASLDDPAPHAPKFAIWTEDRLPWVMLNGQLPAYRRSSREG